MASQSGTPRWVLALASRCPAFTFLAAIICCGLSGSDAAVFEGVLPDRPAFAEFVGKFCYDFRPDASVTLGINVGKAIVETSFVGAYSNKARPVDKTLDPVNGVANHEVMQGEIYFMLFTDQKESWRPAWQTWSATDCEAKKDEASYKQKLDPNGRMPPTMENINISLHLRPRFMYFSFVGCGVTLPLDTILKYRIHTTNELWGWQEELSFDQDGLLMLNAVSSLVFLIFLLCTLRLARAQELSNHPYITLLLLANAASLSSCLLWLLHYSQYIRDGLGSKPIALMAGVSAITAHCCVFLVAMLSSVGWAITLQRLPHRQAFLSFILLIGGLTMFCELHADTAVAQSVKLYGYQSTPGMISLVLKVFMFCWFAYQCQATYDEETSPKRRRFYRWLGFAVSAFTLSLPISAVLAFYVAPHYRYKVVESADVITRAFGQSVLAWLFLGPLSPISWNNGCSYSGHVDLTELG